MAKTSRKQKSMTVKFNDETKVHPALREFFGYCLFKASARLRLIMDEALLPHKMQTHHLGILKLLKSCGPRSQIELGDALGFDKASMVKLIDQLEKNKYVVRKIDPNDRRIKNIQVTEKGSTETNICVSLKDKVEQEFFKNIEKEDREILRKLIPRLLP